MAVLSPVSRSKISNHTDLGRKGGNLLLEGTQGRRYGRCPGPAAAAGTTSASAFSEGRGLGKDPEGGICVSQPLPNLLLLMCVNTAAELSLRPSLKGRCPMFPFPILCRSRGRNQRTYIPMGWMLVKEGSVEEGPEIHASSEETKLKLFSFSQ